MWYRVLGSILWPVVRYIQKRQSEDFSRLLEIEKTERDVSRLMPFCNYSCIKIYLGGIYSVEPAAAKKTLT